MSPELENSLHDSFPAIFRGMDRERSYVHDGWYALLYCLCVELGPIVGKDFVFLQIKEKFDDLVIYYHPAHYFDNKSEVDALISLYKKAARYLCRFCGKPNGHAAASSRLVRVFPASLCERCQDRGANGGTSKSSLISSHELLQQIRDIPEIIQKTKQEINGNNTAQDSLPAHG